MDGYDYTICLKGFLMILYYRIKYRRSGNVYICFLYTFFHILICLFLTPIYLGIISTYLGFILHRKRANFYLKTVLYEREAIYLGMTISFWRGFVMFPYIITFFPFMAILLIPSIFSFKYYLYIYNMYITILTPWALTYKC